MKSSSLLVLACLVSMPVMAQELPDEINYAPYEARYISLQKETARLEAKLIESQNSLAEARKFIREMTEYIETLRQNIQRNQYEIVQLRREIPELERRISDLRYEDQRVMSDLRSRQNEESILISRYHQAERDLRPLEANLAQKQQRLRDLENDLNKFRKQERDAGSRHANAMTELSRKDAQIQSLRNEIKKFQDELRTGQTKINELERQISTRQNAIKDQERKLQELRSRIGALDQRVAQTEAELSRLRSGNAPQPQIQAAERRVQEARKTRDAAKREISQLESGISSSKTQLKTMVNQLDQLKRNQAALPSRISSAESKLRQYESERTKILNEANRYKAEHETAKRNIQLREQQITALRNDMRIDEQNVARQRHYLDSINRDLNNVRSVISALTTRSRNLNADISRLTQTIRSHEQRIPALQQEIYSFEKEIADGEKELSVARNDERTFVDAVARDQANLNDAINRRNVAEIEMSKRRSLYNRYLSDAERLGAEEASSGIALGKTEGEKLAHKKAQENGSSLGREMGILEARYWAGIRGELQGYARGHEEGMASADDISRATSDAQLKASQDAELFAQRTLKPIYFEEFVQDEMKKPLVLKGLNVQKGLSRIQEMAFVTGIDNISQPTPQEVADSNALETPLDGTIAQLAKDLKAAKEKYKYLSDPSVTFVAPTDIPFVKPDCSQVYKGLAVFKASCEGSYKGTFTNNFHRAVKEAYFDSYKDLFDKTFHDVNSAERESAYTLELKNASEIARQYGIKVGQAEIYVSTYERVYEVTYRSELEKAKAKALVDAKSELAHFLSFNPLLTISDSSLSAEVFRGGEEVIVTGKVKNIGRAPFKGAALIRITSVENADILQGETVLNDAIAFGETALPQLKVKVHPRARSGEKIVVKGLVDLPGDLYRTSRQEAFELTEILAVNPANDLSLDYNTTPNIKGVFSRYIHNLTVSISPTVEDINDGYEIAVSPVGEGLELMDMKESRAVTGALKKGVSKDVKVSYTFRDKAKGKTINLELSLSYKGKVIRKEIITVKPR